MMIRIFVYSLLFFVFHLSHAQGPYSPAAGKPGSIAIHKDSSIIKAWASECEIQRGWQDISNTSLGYANVGDSTDALGKPGTNGVVSLGDGGTAVVKFNGVLHDGPGYDFAVFENSFSDTYLELAFVEVSSDGINFFRFDAVSLTQDTVQVGSFDTLETSYLHNLAGKFRLNYGTPFDLSELSGISGLDIDSITHIKIIDVVGSINNAYATYDSQNNKVNDPWNTPFGSSGFDLDAVAAINIKFPTSINENSNLNEVDVYPNPFSNRLVFQNLNQEELKVVVRDVAGKWCDEFMVEKNTIFNYSSNFNPGIYFFSLYMNNKIEIKKLIKSE
jgi:hypothetical protein